MGTSEQGADLAPLAIYIHWPYCARICPYCDFNVYKGAENEDLVKAILLDLEHWRKWSGQRRISSIHFGGGTPSLLPSGDVGLIIEKVNQLWRIEDEIEIGLEANPNDGDGTKWRNLSRVGINRLSLGVQSFDDQALKFLGRDHNGHQARAAATMAAETFSNVSLDLIFGWTGQTEAKLNHDLDITLGLGLQHVSTYQLTIEEGTAFAKAESRGQERAVDSDISARFYGRVSDRLVDAGFLHYEVSNFAKPGFRSRHNLAYWRGHDYVGVGPGAHGRLTKDGQRYATETCLRPKAYMDSVTAKGSGINEKIRLDKEDWGDEYVMMGLRTTEGISLTRYEELAGVPLNPAAVQNLLKDGLIEQVENLCFATSKGRPVLDYVTRKLLV